MRPTWRRNASAALSFLINVLETGNGYSVQALLPGLNPENLEISVLQNTLPIKGHLEARVKQGLRGTCLVWEIGVGTFERSISFPRIIGVDKIETSYLHGAQHEHSVAHAASAEADRSITGTSTSLKIITIRPARSKANTPTSVFARIIASTKRVSSKTIKSTSPGIV